MESPSLFFPFEFASPCSNNYLEHEKEKIAKLLFFNEQYFLFVFPFNM